MKWNVISFLSLCFENVPCEEYQVAKLRSTLWNGEIPHKICIIGIISMSIPLDGVSTRRESFALSRIQNLSTSDLQSRMENRSQVITNVWLSRAGHNLFRNYVRLNADNVPQLI